MQQILNIKNYNIIYLKQQLIKMSSDQENIKNNDAEYSDQGEGEGEDPHYSSVLSQGGKKDQTHQHQENQTQHTHQQNIENDQHKHKGTQPKQQELVSIHETNQHVGIVSAPLTLQNDTADHQIEVSGHQQKHQQVHQSQNEHHTMQNQQNDANNVVIEQHHPIQESIKLYIAEPVNLDIVEAVHHAEVQKQETNQNQQQHEHVYEHKQQRKRSSVEIQRSHQNKQEEPHHQKIQQNQILLSHNNYEQPVHVPEPITIAQNHEIKEEPVIQNNNQNIQKVEHVEQVEHKPMIDNSNEQIKQIQKQEIQHNQHKIPVGTKLQKQQDQRTLSQSREQHKKDQNVDNIENQQPSQIKLIKEHDALQLDRGIPDDSIISRRILAASVKQAPKKQQQVGSSSKLCECSIM